MKLLLIEDSERLRRTLVIGLKNLGYLVDECDDGYDGYCLAKSEDYDLIILDLMLPTLDGLSVLKKLRDEKVATAVLILTAKDLLEDRINGLNLGADDYLCKPFAFDELEARVKALIRRSSQHASSNIQVAGINIDIELKEVSCGDTKLALTPHEYKLLELLVLNHGKVMSYSMIENMLYDQAAEVTKNTIEAHMSALRNKLKPHKMNHILKTRRGFGYYIEAS